MSELKRKGQIVPKRFIRAVEKKSQHLVKFGCDVEIVGNAIYMLSDGCAIHVPSVKYCNTKKNKRRVKGFVVSNLIRIDGSRVKGDTCPLLVDKGEI